MWKLYEDKVLIIYSSNWLNTWTKPIKKIVYQKFMYDVMEVNFLLFSIFFFFLLLDTKSSDVHNIHYSSRNKVWLHIQSLINFNLAFITSLFVLALRKYVRHKFNSKSTQWHHSCRWLLLLFVVDSSQFMNM